MQPSQKEHVIGAVHCKKEGMLFQPLRWRCVECAIHHEQDVREQWRTQKLPEGGQVLSQSCDITNQL